jgi:hypothetical protein
MTFKNEYLPKPEAETSEFLKRARTTLRIGNSAYDSWTADRDRDAVLVRTGMGHSAESANQDYWRFLDATGIYSFSTDLVSSAVASPTTIQIERVIHFTQTASAPRLPGEDTIALIKQALQEYKDYGVVSRYEHCELTLRAIDGGVL